MSKQQEIKQKSRLGTLLMHRGLITRRQLDEALALQTGSNKMLGEIMVQQGWITESELAKALKGQSRYRMTAAIGAILLGPVQPFISSANAAVDTTLHAEQNEIPRAAKFSAMRPLTSSELSKIKGQNISTMTPLSEKDMASVSGRGVSEDVAYLQNILNNNNEEADLPETVTMTALKSIFPGLNILTDYEVKDIEYYGDGPSITFHEDGSIVMQAPKRIGEIAFKNVNFRGASGPALGDLSIRDLRISEGSTITLRVRN